MDYEGFKAEVTTRIVDREGPGACVRVHRVRKNNGVMLDGLTIMREGENVSPTIYLEPFYDRYRRGADLDSLTDEILALYRSRSCAGKRDRWTDENWGMPWGGSLRRLVNC